MALAKCGNPNCAAQFEDEHHGHLPRLPSPQCGSTVRTIEVSIVDTLEFHDSIRLKLKRVGFKKPIAESISGDEFFHRKAKWVSKERLIDREDNRYREKVTDPSTGEVIHACDEPLDQHIGHGKAKPKS